MLITHIKLCMIFNFLMYSFSLSPFSHKTWRNVLKKLKRKVKRRKIAQQQEQEKSKSTINDIPYLGKNHGENSDSC